MAHLGPAPCAFAEAVVANYPGMGTDQSAPIKVIGNADAIKAIFEYLWHDNLWVPTI